MKPPEPKYHIVVRVQGMVVSAVALSAALVWAAPGAAGAAAPSPSPPVIYRVITRPLCAELHEHIAPAIGMMLENDTTIGKSPDLFQAYNRAALSGVDNSASNSTSMNGGVPMTGESANGMLNDEQNITLLGMENLIRPLANNIIAIKKLLDSPALLGGTGKPADDRELQKIRGKLLATLKYQETSLDIISGFVDTQQMGDLQHAGEEYISAMNQSDTSQTSTPAPNINPLLQNPNQVGLSQNPYDVDLAEVPGLTLGYNPVTRLLDALHWTIKQTATQESDAAKSVMEGAALCRS